VYSRICDAVSDTVIGKMCVCVRDVCARYDTHGHACTSAPTCIPFNFVIAFFGSGNLAVTFFLYIKMNSCEKDVSQFFVLVACVHV